MEKSTLGSKGDAKFDRLCLTFWCGIPSMRWQLFGPPPPPPLILGPVGQRVVQMTINGGRWGRYLSDPWYHWYSPWTTRQNALRGALPTRESVRGIRYRCHPRWQGEARQGVMIIDNVTCYHSRSATHKIPVGCEFPTVKGHHYRLEASSLAYDTSQNKQTLSLNTHRISSIKLALHDRSH